MSHYHIEVHNRHNEIEHLVCLNCLTEQEAIERIVDHYRERQIKIGLWQNVKDKPEIAYYIFRIVPLDESKPVIYIAGEYRSSYPI